MKPDQTPGANQDAGGIPVYPEPPRAEPICDQCRTYGRTCTFRYEAATAPPEPPRPDDPLTVEEVAALQSGDAIEVIWSGGNGPHNYIVHEHGDTLYAGDPRNDNALTGGGTFIGQEPYHTRVWRLGRVAAPEGLSLAVERLAQALRWEFHDGKDHPLDYERALLAAIAVRIGYETGQPAMADAVMAEYVRQSGGPIDLNSDADRALGVDAPRRRLSPSSGESGSPHPDVCPECKVPIRRHLASCTVQECLVCEGWGAFCDKHRELGSPTPGDER